MLSFPTKCLTCGEMATVSSETSKLEVILERPDLSHIEATCHCGRKMILFIDLDQACEFSRQGWPIVLWRNCDDSLIEFRAKVRAAQDAGKDGYRPDEPTLETWERLMGYEPKP